MRRSFGRNGNRPTSREDEPRQYRNGQSDNGNRMIWGHFPVLPQSEVRKLITNFQRDGDIEVRNRIVTHNIGLVISIAKKYLGHGLDIDDLVNEGVIGMFRAIEKFDIGKGCQFSTYAVYWIRQSIRTAISNTAHIIRIPLYEHRKTEKLRRAVFEISGQERHLPTTNELVAATGMSSKTIRRILHVQRMRYVVSYGLISKSRNDEYRIETATSCFSPLDILIMKEDLCQCQGDMQRFMDAFAHTPLTDRNRQIFTLRYGLNNTASQTHTFQAIADTLGLSKEMTRNIVKSILTKLGAVDTQWNDPCWLIRKRESIVMLEELVCG